MTDHKVPAAALPTIPRDSFSSAVAMQDARPSFRVVHEPPAGEGEERPSKHPRMARILQVLGFDHKMMNLVSSFFQTILTILRIVTTRWNLGTGKTRKSGLFMMTGWPSCSVLLIPLLMRLR